VFVQMADALYAPREALDEWRIHPSAEERSIDFKGQAYVPLSATPGFKSKVDYANQSIDLYFAPQAFSALRLTKEISKRPPVSEVLPSAFLNYDINYAGSSLKTAGSIHDLGALWEAGLSNKWGVLTSSQAARNLTRDRTLGVPTGGVRLETLFTHDFPEENRTLRLGDSATHAGMWGRSVYFGGLQYGTNYALTPGIITQPLPTLQGLSAAPSTVELYVNGVLRQSSNIPTGPFAIDSFPVLSGGGEARLVVRDLLGRETVITQSFITSTQLLADGLDDWSFEAGNVRIGLGNESNHYGPAFASGFWRHGYHDVLTVEGRGEVTKSLKTFGAAIAAAMPYQLLGTAAVVASDHELVGRGSKWLVGLDRQDVHSGISVQAQGASRGFRTLGQDAGLSDYKLQLAGTWTYYTEKAGSFGVGFANLSRYDENRVSTVSANYTVALANRSTLTLTATRAVVGLSANSVGLTFTMPLDNNRILSSAANNAGGKRDYYVAASQNPNPENNFGWRALVGHQQDAERLEAGAYYMGRYGNQSGEVSYSPNQTAVRIGANGGMVLADGHFFVTRRLDQSYAVVEVAGYENVGIGIGSNVQTRTDKNGIALIPQIWPYQSNSIRIDPNELPMSAEIESIERTIVPAWRSAVKVDYPVRAGRGALLKIVFDDGQPAPAGAIAQIEGDKEQFYVARRGEAFLTGLSPSNRVRITWKNQACTIEVKLPPASGKDEMLRLGPLSCKGVAR
jgi:outer membrane usher protein